MILTMENRSARRKTHPSVTLSITNPTWSSLGSNPGLCGVRPATSPSAVVQPGLFLRGRTNGALNTFLCISATNCVEPRVTWFSTQHCGTYNNFIYFSFSRLAKVNVLSVSAFPLYSAVCRLPVG
jgi:hypothetical protein